MNPSGSDFRAPLVAQPRSTRLLFTRDATHNATQLHTAAQRPQRRAAWRPPRRSLTPPSTVTLQHAASMACRGRGCTRHTAARLRLSVTASTSSPCAAASHARRWTCDCRRSPECRESGVRRAHHSLLGARAALAAWTRSGESTTSARTESARDARESTCAGTRSSYKYLRLI